MPEPIIPETITVHLGAPSASARNVVVPFIDYIKNVASSEIYPTWPESALRANILAQISFALNRVYTEWYRSQGYDFDITNSTRYDKKFIENRDYFDTVSRIVDDIFNNYVVRQGTIQPYFTQYCDGRNTTCDGLSQWGSVDLANRGLVPYEILQYYYGNEINIITNAPVQANVPSYPGVPLRLGDFSEEVRTIQRQLNRIALNYPAIPRIPEENGFFGPQTEAAVRKFQQLFDLTVDGIVGKATWYRIKYLYNAVKGLSELQSEGITFDEASRIFERELEEGDTGVQVRLIQYYLAVISYFDNEIPQVVIDGNFDGNTVAGVRAFQRKYGLPETGVVDRQTWNVITRIYNSIVQGISPEIIPGADEIYPGRFLSLGMEGEDIRTLQRFLQEARSADPSIPAVETTGTFDQATDAAVRYIQAQNGLPVNGIVGPLTWDAVVRLARQSRTAG